MRGQFHSPMETGGFTCDSGDPLFQPPCRCKRKSKSPGQFADRQRSGGKVKDVGQHQATPARLDGFPGFGKVLQQSANGLGRMPVVMTCFVIVEQGFGDSDNIATIIEGDHRGSSAKAF